MRKRQHIRGAEEGDGKRLEYDEECTEIWRNSPGLISSYSVDGDVFIMEKAHGGPVAFKIKNGKKVEL